MFPLTTATSSGGEQPPVYPFLDVVEFTYSPDNLEEQLTLAAPLTRCMLILDALDGEEVSAKLRLMDASEHMNVLELYVAGGLNDANTFVVETESGTPIITIDPEGTPSGIPLYAVIRRTLSGWKVELNNTRLVGSLNVEGGSVSNVGQFSFSGGSEIVPPNEISASQLPDSGGMMVGIIGESKPANQASAGKAGSFIVDKVGGHAYMYVGGGWIQFNIQSTFTS